MKDNQKNTFYKHFCQDTSTQVGSRLATRLAKSIYQMAEIPDAATILEIGAGRGIFANVCRGQGAQYWAIEPNEQMAGALEQKGITVWRAVVPPMPPTEQQFDVVVMISVMEHMDSMAAALELTKQVHALLKPGGRFVIYCPDYLNWRHRFFQSDFSHNYITTRLRLEGLLLSAGFKEVDSYYRNMYFTGFMSILTSAFAAMLPFAQLNAILPKNRLILKLWKMQMSLLRRTLTVGKKDIEGIAS
jgi:SAM-dependent methyltransferase